MKARDKVCGLVILIVCISVQDGEGDDSAVFRDALSWNLKRTCFSNTLTQSNAFLTLDCARGSKAWLERLVSGTDTSGTCVANQAALQAGTVIADKNKECAGAGYRTSCSFHRNLGLNRGHNYLMARYTCIPNNDDFHYDNVIHYDQKLGSVLSETNHERINWDGNEGRKCTITRPKQSKNPIILVPLVINVIWLGSTDKCWIIFKIMNKDTNSVIRTYDSYDKENSRIEQFDVFNNDLDDVITVYADEIEMTSIARSTGNCNTRCYKGKIWIGFASKDPLKIECGTRFTQPVSYACPVIFMTPTQPIWGEFTTQEWRPPTKSITQEWKTPPEFTTPEWKTPIEFTTPEWQAPNEFSTPQWEKATIETSGGKMAVYSTAGIIFGVTFVLGSYT